MIIIVEQTNKLLDFLKNNSNKNKLTYKENNIKIEIEIKRNYTILYYTIDNKFVKDSTLNGGYVELIDEIYNEIVEFINDYKNTKYFSNEDIFNLITKNKNHQLIYRSPESIYFKMNNKKYRISDHSNIRRNISGGYEDVDIFLYSGYYPIGYKFF